jgi:hypothetical protein
MEGGGRGGRMEEGAAYLEPWRAAYLEGGWRREEGGGRGGRMEEGAAYLEPWRAADGVWRLERLPAMAGARKASGCSWARWIAGRLGG